MRDPELNVCFLAGFISGMFNAKLGGPAWNTQVTLSQRAASHLMPANQLTHRHAIISKTIPIPEVLA